MTAVFVTGTDTGCGKTYVSEFLLRGLSSLGRNVSGMKPIATGVNAISRENEDISRLLAVSNTTVRPELVNQYCFPEPCSPNIASELNGTEITLNTIVESFLKLEQIIDFVVVEGVGGWEVPIGESHTVADLAVALEIPVILVVGMKLGCINHAILTANAMERSKVSTLGWVANFYDSELILANEVLATLTRRLKIPLLYKLSEAEPVENAKQLAKKVLGKLGSEKCS